ncbi:MAG: molybdopterin synthase sulfur carrier subunit [Firmicutes bacterium]|nr:molybdopterin synthase sulfur carrier subunit [Bacillota bacterium]
MEVLLFASLARSFGGGSVRIQDGPATAGEVIERLKAMAGPQFHSDLAGVTILLNGRNVEFLDGLATRVTPGDTITLIPPVAGG